MSRIVVLMLIPSAYILVTSSFLHILAQTLVPGIHAISFIPEVKFTWVIISSDPEISINLRYLGIGTTPPVSIVATALTNPVHGNDLRVGLNAPTTIAGSEVLNAGWISPNRITLQIKGNSSLYHSYLVSVIASPYTSTPPPISAQTGCDSSYPDFCLPSPPPLLNCDQQRKNFIVLLPDPHKFDADGDGRGSEE